MICTSRCPGRLTTAAERRDDSRRLSDWLIGVPGNDRNVMLGSTHWTERDFNTVHTLYYSVVGKNVTESEKKVTEKVMVKNQRNKSRIGLSKQRKPRLAFTKRNTLDKCA